MDKSTRRFYYCTTPDCIEDVLENGIEPGKATVIIPKLNTGIAFETGIMLWDNLDILEGKLYKSLKSGGYEFLAVDIPSKHPIQRNYDGLSLIAKDYKHLGYLILQMHIPFDIRQIMNTEELIALKKDISGLAEEDKKKVSFERLMGKIANDKKTLKFVMDSALDENWDINVGFYKTFQTIPSSGEYSIQRHHQ